MYAWTAQSNFSKHPITETHNVMYTNPSKPEPKGIHCLNEGSIAPTVFSGLGTYNTSNVY